MRSFLALLLLIASTAIARAPIEDPALLSHLWQQTSAEYQALCLQTYRQAAERLPSALADPSWTAALEQRQMPPERYRDLPAAVLLDVDDTVLSTSSYQARAILSGGHDPARWDRWLARADAPALPGAIKFVQQARALGIRPLYVTNRRCALRPGSADPCPQEADTLRNLGQAGFPVRPDDLLLLGEQPGWDRDKTHRRRYLSERFRILVVIGDDLGDFLAGVRSNVSPQQRLELAYQWVDLWGERWFVLPNPVYGSWRRALGSAPTDYLDPPPE